ncbi:hypothetical protein [Aeromonas veronii]|uniref:hypothetical protein n=1 Tax=Aeromonas veronii TaxID=654 RepID=UPI003D1ACECF
MQKIILPMLLVASFNATAFTVDSMFKVHKEKDNYLTIKNNSERPEFISTKLTRVDVVNGKVAETPFDPKEFMSWPIYTTPTNIIIDPHGAERVSVVKLVKSNKNDVMLGISLVPDAVSSFNNEVKVNLGYKVWYLIPGSEDMTGVLKGKMAGGSKISLTNDTNKHLTINIAWCDNEKSTCSASLFLLSGLTKTFDIPQKEKKTITVEYSDALGKTKKTIII